MRYTVEIAEVIIEDGLVIMIGNDNYSYYFEDYIFVDSIWNPDDNPNQFCYWMVLE